MGRFLAGVLSALLLITAGFFIWQGQASIVQPLPPAPPPREQGMLTAFDIAEPPTATEKTREQKRFSRYDKDKNGAIAREEYLTARRKAYAKLDRNGDGRLSFEEYAIKTTAKFATADRDRTGQLTPAEFLTTRIIPKSSKQKCPPPNRVQLPAPDAEAENDA